MPRPPFPSPPPWSGRARNSSHPALPVSKKSHSASAARTAARSRARWASAAAVRPQPTPRRRPSLRRALLPPLLFLGGLVALVGGYFTYESLGDHLRTQALDRTEALARAAAHAAVTLREQSEVQQLVAALGVEEGVDLIVVAVGDPAKVVACSRQAWVGEAVTSLPLEVSQDLLRALQLGEITNRFEPGFMRYEVTLPLRSVSPSDASKPAQRGAVKVQVDSNPIESRVKLATWRSSLWQLGSVALTTLLAFLLLQRLVLRPLSAIQAALDRRAMGERTARAPELSGDELGGMAAALNRMLDTTEAQQERITTLVANVPGAVYRCSLDKAWTMLFLSQAIESITGYPASDFVSNAVRRYADLIHPEDRPRVLKGLRDGVAQERTYELEYRVQHAAGEWRWVSERGRAVTGRDDQVVWLDGVIWDVTERKRAEQQLERYVVELEDSKGRIEQQAEMLVEQARELAVARDRALDGARAKSEFLAMMSHEIRTPLNGVIGMTDLLLSSKLDTDQRELARTIQSSGEALLAILNDLLDFSKIEAGRLELEQLEFELETAVEDAVELFAERAQKKGIELVLRLSPELPVTAVGDPGRLRQVLLNLLGNAIKFTERGRVVVEVEPDEQDPEHRKMRFRVTDTGIGIPSDARTRLFRSFSQADASTTRRYGGTGLGLAISKRLVEMMGGEISVESETGAGSSFWFTARFEECAGEGGMDPQVAGKRALIVVHDPEARAAMVESLLCAGLEIEGAAGVEEGLAALRAGAAEGRRPDVVLIDMVMPGGGGIEFGKALGERADLPRVPCLLLTPFGARLDESTLRQARAAAWVSKPVRRAPLRRALLKAFETQGEPPAPLPSRESESKGQAPNVGEAVTGALVLLVEDNPVNQKLAIALLKRLGHRIDLACNGKEAVDAAAKRRYDVVLMDCQMPEMDGFEATRQIRSSELKGQRTPIIAMTANALDGDRERCIACGMDDYVTKPIRQAKLSEAIARALPAHEPA